MAKMMYPPREWEIGPPQRYPERTLPDLIAEWAGRAPDAPAVRQWAETMTYAELHAAAGRLARLLRGHGVGVESRVVVSTLRRPHMITSVLGVLGAGAAYVPVDPAMPPRRRDLLLCDADATVAVVDEAGRDALAGTGMVLVPVPGSGLALPDDTESPQPAGVLRPDNAAYVLFTSGSTGRPKGVAVSHRSMINFTVMCAAACSVGPGTQAIGYASLGFDASAEEIFTALVHGGSIALVPEADRTDIDRLQRFLAEHRVTWGPIPPALLPLLDPEGLPDLGALIVGGELPGPEQVARWSAGGCRFLHWYGPTEATVVVTGEQVTGHWDRPVPIGPPLPNHRCYVVDEHLQPVAAGEPGELCVAGVGLARGYLNRPGRTAERFVPDPFGPPGARMYRTGDLARWEPTGRLAFLGRLDRQVKIAGQRVEIGEVEAAVLAHPDVTQAVVDAVPGPDGVLGLVAYLTPATAPDSPALRAFCADRLSPYMIPGRVHRFDEFPLNSSSKIDMAALRALTERDRTEPVADAPADVTEQAVAAAWARVFHSAPPGRDADFFAAGGHSLLAMRLVAALRTELHRDLAVEDVFAGRTVAGLAARVATAAALTAGAPGTGHDPALSDAQRRLWFINRLSPDSTAYNIALAERLRGPVDVAAVRAALGMVAARHESLRWRVPDRDGVPYVVVSEPGEVPLPVQDVSGAELDAALHAEAVARFDLDTGPLWRARLLRLGPDHHVLAITVHHMVFDGWSVDVLYRDLSACYSAARERRAADLPDLPVTYSDYVAWLAAQRDGSGRADLEWWRAALAGVPTVVDLPRDRARPPIQTYRGASHRREVPAALADRVRAVAAAAGTTPYTVLLAAFAVLLRRLTGSTDLIIGAPTADRRHAAFDDLAGFFVDTLPLRVQMTDDEDFATLVTRCRETVVGAMTHRDVPFDRLVTELGLARDLSRGPLVQVLFNMYTFTEAHLDLDGVRAETLPGALPGSLFDLTLYANERAGGYDLQAVYNPDLYRPARIEALLRGYLTLLDSLLADPAAPIGRAQARPPGGDLPDPTVPRTVAVPVEGVVERVRRVAAERPAAPAVTGPARTLPYGELERLRAAVAGAVRTAGVRPEQAVAVLGARDVTLPPVLLGVLSSGARWLVLDPANPEALLARQAAAADARLLLACPGTTVPAALGGTPAVDVAGLADPTGTPERDGPERDGPELGGPVAADRRGYLTPTSGTTGEPAVVVAGERPLATFLDWYAGRFGLGPADATALLGGLSHDPLLRDALAPLVVGGRVCVPDPDWLRDPDRLVAWLAAERVTVLHLTPQMARLLGAAGGTLPQVRLAVLGGDRLTDHDVATLRRLLPAASVVNAYGTTETPQVQAVHEVEGVAGPDSSGRAPHPVPVGSGVAGTQLLVVGPAGQPAAVGEVGEILVRGPNLAEGYLDGDLTAARFGVNPATGDPEDRVYRTGDVGRYDPDGAVVVEGRLDEQVKVRGHRVEFGEVEAALRAHPDVAAAAVVARRQAGETELVGYAVPRRAAVAGETLRQHLRQRLPEYACPVAVVVLAEFPLTPNGKLNRSALPPPPVDRGRPGTAPVSRVEKLIATVWREVLGVPRVWADDNFFDIGGHSLAIVAVQARLKDVLEREVHVVDLFRHPNIRSLASFLDDGARSTGIDRASRRLAALRERRRPDTTAGTAPSPARSSHDDS